MLDYIMLVLMVLVVTSYLWIQQKSKESKESKEVDLCGCGEFP